MFLGGNLYATFDMLKGNYIKISTFLLVFTKTNVGDSECV